VPVRRVAFTIRVSAPGRGREAVDEGTLRGIVDADSQRIHARLRLKGEQADRVIELRRGG